MNRLTDEQLKANIDALQKQGASSEQIQGYLDSLKSNTSSIAEPEQVGFFKGLIQDTARPFIKVGVSGSTALAGGLALGARALGQKEFAQNIEKATTDIAKEGFDAGYFGNVRPFGTQFLRDDIGTGEAALRTAADITGTGAEIASYAFNPLKVPVKGGFLKNVFNINSLKTVAPFAAPFAIGKTGQAVGEGKTGTESLIEGAGAYLGAVAGFNLFNAGGAMLGNFGARLMKNPIIKAQAEKLADLADVVVNAIPQGVRQKVGETLNWNSRLYQKEYNTAHKNLVDATIKEFTTPVPDGNEAYQGYRQNLNKYITSQYQKKATDFADVFSSPHQVDNYSSTQEAIQKAKGEIDTLIKSGLYDSGQALQNYIGRVEGLIGNKFNKPQTLKVIDALYSSADAFIGRSNAEDSFIRDISHALLDDATKSVGSKSPELLARWNQARTFAQDISTNVNSEFASKLRNAPKLNNFVDSLLTGSGPSREEIASFNQAFSDTERADISQNIFNSIVSKVKDVRDMKDGAAIIDKALKNLSQYGDNNIINEGHAAQLENLSDLMKENFNDFLFKIKTQNTEAPVKGVERAVTPVAQEKVQSELTKDIVKLAEAGRYSELGDRISKITGVEELQAVLRLTGDNKEIQNNIGQDVMRGILNKNKSSFSEKGKYDFTGFFTDLDKIGGSNKDEIFNSLFNDTQREYLNNLYKIKEEIGSLENIAGTNLLKVSHALTGFLYSLTGKVVPATYHFSQLSKISSKNKVPYAQLKNLSEELISSGKLDEGRFQKIGEFIKSSADQAGRVAQQIGSSTVDSFYKAAETMFGRPLTDQEKEELNNIYTEHNK